MELIIIRLLQANSKEEVNEVINTYLDIFNTYPELYKMAKNAKHRIEIQNKQKRKFWLYELN